MFETIYKTSYGLEYFLISPSQWEILKPLSYECGWTDYDRMQIGLHILNCGYGIIDTECQKPIDNEYDLDEIYSLVEKMPK